MNQRTIWMGLAVLLTTLSGTFAFADGPLPFKKVMIVIFENEDYSAVEKLPFFAQFAKRGSLMSNFHAEKHPSQPNYIALISGDTHGVSGDGDTTVDAQHIGNLLEAKGKDWKVYAESYPSHCYLGSRSGTYARKHTPFISFKNVQNNPVECAKIQDAQSLPEDIQNGKLSDFSLFIPDMNNDGHDTGAAYADKWFEKSFSPYLQDPRFMKGMLVVATFDESGFFTPGNPIYTAFFGDGVKAGSVSNQKYNHYDLLRTIEAGLGLDSLNLKDAKASIISGIWN